MKRYIVWIMAILALFTLAACSAAGGAEAEPASDAAAQDTAETMPAEDEAMMEDKEDESMAEEGEAMMEDKEDEAMAEEEMAEHDESMAEEDEAMMEEGEAMTGEEMAESDESMMAELPAWQTIALTDVRTGETFALADFHGKTVFVEPMATWCTNCRRQLTNVSAARAELNDEDVVFIALSVETNISNEQLASYTHDTGFDWTFAVATPELLQELVATFGQSITNPPSTPHFIVRPDGTYTELVTGIEPAEQIIANLQAEG